MVRCTTPPDLLGRNSRTRSSRDSRLEEAGFELFVPLGISTSSSWWSRSRKPHGAPKGSFSVAEPKVRIQLSPAESQQTFGSSIPPAAEQTTLVASPATTSTEPVSATIGAPLEIPPRFAEDAVLCILAAALKGLRKPVPQQPFRRPASKRASLSGVPGGSEVIPAFAWPEDMGNLRLSQFAVHASRHHHRT